MTVYPIRMTRKRQRRYNPASDDFKKEEFPFYWLARVNGRYSLAMEKALKKVGMDVTRWRILFTLKEQGTCSISEIAEHAVAKVPTITKTVYRMKDDGLLDTSVRAEDGRVTDVSLTEKGWDVIGRIQEATSDIFNDSFRGMTEAQISRLNRLLETIFNNLPEH